MGAKKKGNVLVICCHSDDQVIGPGGLTAKLAKEGYNVYTFIFSYGEVSHPHMKPEYIVKTRVQESRDADALLGGKGVFFLGLSESKLIEEFKEKKMNKKLERIFRDYKPKKIFTHSIDDMHPLHRFVHNQVLKVHDDISKKEKCKCDVYMFDVWNIWSVKKQIYPELVIDVTPYFKQKIKALNLFKSQFNVFSYVYLNNILYLSVYVKAFINGVRHGCRLAEVFHKIR